MHFSFLNEKKNGSRIFYESIARYMFVKLKRFKNQVNTSATFMKPFVKANCAIFK